MGILRIARIWVILCLAVSFALPKTTAALASLGLGSGETIVICTGAGLQTISLSGEPGDQPEIADEEACALVHALFTAPPEPDIGAPVVLTACPFVLAPHPPRSAEREFNSSPRAPPRCSAPALA